MAIGSYYLNPEGQLETGIEDERRLREILAERRGLLWVNISEVTEEHTPLLEHTFGFHRLAVEDCVSPNVHRPKIDDFGDHLFIIVHGINYTAESELVETAELALFLGEHYVVTAHTYPLFSVESVRQLVEQDSRPMKRGAEFLAHAIIDALIDNILPTVDEMGERADNIEIEVIHNPAPSILDAIMKLKRSALRLHRVVAPQREVMNRLSRGEFSLISQEAEIFFRDIYDHIARIEDMNQSVRDRTSDALSTYLSSVANKQNETMKLLAIVAAIFLPLTLVAGIYGMNFDYMPELTWHWSYFIVVGSIGAVILIMLWIFWARDWISVGRRKMGRVAAAPFKVDPQRLVHYVGHLDYITRLPRPLWEDIHRPSKEGDEPR